MCLARSGFRGIHTIRCACLIAVIFALSSTTLYSAQWDREGARLSLEKARNIQEEISSTPEPTKNQYLSCIKSYRLVYLKDPHFSGCDDAIYASGMLYEEMGNRFDTAAYYNNAVKFYKFLISDYNSSPYCPDALLRLGNLYRDQLADNDAADEAYELLRTRYKKSKAALSIAKEIDSVSVPQANPSNAPLAPASEAAAKSAPLQSSLQNPSVIQGIRFWTTDEYTRVVIDMDRETNYSRARLSNPDRVYFDISNSKLSAGLHEKTFEIGDEFLKSVRLARNRGNVARVVFDLETVKDYTVSELHDPFRIIVDIRGSRSAQANTDRVSKESKPRQDEISPEISISKLQEPLKSEIQQQAGIVQEEIALPSTSPAIMSAPLSKQTEKARISTAESIDSSETSPVRSTKTAVSATAKEAVANKSPDVSHSPAQATDQPSMDTKSVPSTRVGKAVESSVGKGTDPPQMVAKIEGMPSSDAGEPVSKPISVSPAKVAEAAGANAKTPTNVPPAVNTSTISAPKTASLTSRGDRTLTRMLGLKVGRIVLDPGHGGHDTGTIGPGGLMEKDLTLELSKALRQLLESRINIDVVLTREKDVFLSLEERTAIANRCQADLFISIHANSSSAQSTSGVETYFLDFAKNSSARNIAARENATSLGNLRDLEDLIKSIAQADKSAESRELAGIIQKSLYNSARQLLPSTRNRGVRSAPFVVLIGANMPSILAEIAFISNPRDESILKKKENQEQLAKALFAGIEDYMNTLGSDVAQNQARTN